MMPAADFTIYLASKSARRRDLLDQVGVAHRAIELSEGPDGDVDESEQAGEAPADYVLRLARVKALAGWRKMNQQNFSPRPLLAADTTVALNGAILGKPESPAHAVDMLRSLSGTTHLVHTAVAVIWQDHVECTLSSTEVRFRRLEEQELLRYVATSEPLDKAGGYGIQGQAAAFVECLDGSHSGVVGLPLFETLALLKKFGVNIP